MLEFEKKKQKIDGVRNKIVLEIFVDSRRITKDNKKTTAIRHGQNISVFDNIVLIFYSYRQI